MESITFLLIDADEASRNFLAQILHRKGYKTIYASTGQQGIAIASQDVPNMIIMDTNLPDMSGVKVIEELRLNRRTSVVPIIVLSSRSDPEEMRLCLAAGSNEYYVKSGMVTLTMVDSIPKILLQVKGKQSQDRQGLVFSFVSAKGGVGTSSLCANIAMNIARNVTESRVAVVDLVLPIGSIASMVGCPSEKNVVTLTDEENIGIDQIKAHICQPAQWMFDLIPGAPDPEQANRLQVRQIPAMVNSLRKNYDFIVIDLGRSLSKISMPIILDSDVIVLVLGTDHSSVKLTEKIWSYLKAQGVEPGRVYPVLNRAVGLEGLTKVEAERMLNLPIRLTFPYMMGNFSLANNQNVPITSKFPTDTASMILKQASIEMTQLATRLSIE